METSEASFYPSVCFILYAINKREGTSFKA